MNEIEFTYYGENDEEITVTVEYLYTAGSKPRRYGHPDDWHDGDGAEIELVTAAFADGKKMTTKQFYDFEQAHGDSVREQIDDYENEREDDEDEQED